MGKAWLREAHVLTTIGLHIVQCQDCFLLTQSWWGRKRVEGRGHAGSCFLSNIPCCPPFPNLCWGICCEGMTTSLCLSKSVKSPRSFLSSYSTFSPVCPNFQSIPAMQWIWIWWRGHSLACCEPLDKCCTWSCLKGCNALLLYCRAGLYYYRFLSCLFHFSFTSPPIFLIVRLQADFSSL